LGAAACRISPEDRSTAIILDSLRTRRDVDGRRT
jgi:hypothetical protein